MPGTTPSPHHAGTTRDRLASAAVELFQRQGYEATTVDDIAALAGVGRRTFFRSFRSKEEVVFPNHEEILAKVKVRLDAFPDESAIDAACNGARVILRHYVDTREIAVERYRLIGQVPTLREREIVSIAAYQRLFRERLEPDHAADVRAVLRAEIFAASLAAAHNFVLRRWLREGGTSDPFAHLDYALELIRDLYKISDPSELPARSEGAGAGLLVMAVDESVPTEAIVSEIERVRRAAGRRTSSSNSRSRRGRRTT